MESDCFYTEISFELCDNLHIDKVVACRLSLVLSYLIGMILLIGFFFFVLKKQRDLLIDFEL